MTIIKSLRHEVWSIIANIIISIKKLVTPAAVKHTLFGSTHFIGTLFAYGFAFVASSASFVMVASLGWITRATTTVRLVMKISVFMILLVVVEITIVIPLVTPKWHFAVSRSIFYSVSSVSTENMLSSVSEFVRAKRSLLMDFFDIKLIKPSTWV